MPVKQRKIAIMGFRSVGKSSLTIQFVENQFVDSYDPTIENTFRKTVKVNNQDYSLELIDTAGQDEFSFVSQTYCMNTDGYVLVYSVDSEKSFDIVKSIYGKLKDMTGQRHIPLVLVGNKTDLRMKRVVATETGRQLAESWKGAFLETSAKENQKVPDIFRLLISEIEKADGNHEEKSSCIVS
jgi:Ras family protein